MNILTIAIKNIKEIISDKRTVALLFVAPLFLITLIYLLFSTDYKEINVGYIGELPALTSDNNVSYKSYDDKQKMIDDVQAEKLDGAVDFATEDKEIKLPAEIATFVMTPPTIEVPNYTIYLNGEDPVFDPTISSSITQGILFENSPLTVVKEHDDYTLEDYVIVAVIAIITFFFSFLIVGISFLRERKSVTLTRILTYNVVKSSVTFGYLLGFGTIAIIQSIVIELFSIYILDINIVGSIPFSIIVNCIVALVGISLGSLISVFASNEFQVLQFIPVIIIPQIIFCGILPYGGIYQTISNLFPVTYAFRAQKEILLQANYNVWNYILILFTYIAVFSLLNTVLLRRIRKV